MEKRFKRNLLMALGASGALVAVTAATAWLRKSGDVHEGGDAESAPGPAPGATSEPTKLPEEPARRTADGAAA